MKFIKEFESHEITYDYDIDKGCFSSSFDNDYQLFLIWSKARSKESEIIDDLRCNFNVIKCFNVSWSRGNINDNFHRIYDVPPNGAFAAKRNEVGDGDFIAVIIRDSHPRYEYRFDASGRFKLVNSNVVDKKQIYRGWVGGSYMIHSTDNLKEFFNNASLLFGKDLTLGLFQLDSWNGIVSDYNKDLVGANGWSSCEELFETLNLATEYVVLRGGDKVSETVKTLSGDVDILCANIDEFCAVANARNIWNSKNFFHVKIAGKDVLFDIRTVGDDYFDKNWQKDIIRQRVKDESGIYVPRVDDYFFSHLYHSYVHKPYFYTKYSERLGKLSSKIGLKYNEDSLKEDSAIRLLRGFLSAKGYKVTMPIDDQVYLNVRFISKLQSVNLVRLYCRALIIKLSNQPNKFLQWAKVIAKKNAVIYKVLFNLRAKLKSVSSRT